MNRAMAYQKGGGVKISSCIQPTASDEYLQFLQQLGIQYCYTWLEDHQVSYDFIAALRERTEQFGITLYNAANLSLAKSPAIHLGLPDRERDLEAFCRMVETLARAGVHTTTITWEPNGTVCTDGDTVVANQVIGGITRGGAVSRGIDLDILRRAPNSHGRVYEKEEIWENFRVFADYIRPTIEKEEVRISLHPNDPPTDSVLGIATLIQRAEDYRRAFRIADSDFFGMEFCCGCWLEGGTEAFGELFANIREFVAAEKVFIVHFRNVTGTLPRFTETFVDDGYQNMYPVMKAFAAAGYTGTLVLDHSPILVAEAGPCAETAYANGYLKALLQAAETELGKR